MASVGSLVQALGAHDLLTAFEPVYIHGGGSIGYPGTKLGHFLRITKVIVEKLKKKHKLVPKI
jgi:hypothetical protein